MEQSGASNLGAKWSQVQPTKTHLFWSCAASIAVPVIVGFTWGGWVTGSTAQAAAAVAASEAVATRLVPTCVGQFERDPAKNVKLARLKSMGSWLHSDYVQQQGWATMPGEPAADGRVAHACAKFLVSLE